MILYKQYKSIFFQLCRFGIVGVSAVIINLLIVIFIVETFDWPPLLANIIGFIVACQIAFFGHNLWTFKMNTGAHNAWLKFVMVATFSLGLTQLLFFILLHVFVLYYVFALILTQMIVPIVTFLLSKYWAFRH